MPAKNSSKISKRRSPRKQKRESSSPGNGSIVDLLKKLSPEERAERIRNLTRADALTISHTWENWARAEQLEPKQDWDFWVVKAGRGWGKTRTGAEWIKKLIRKDGVKRIGLIGANPRDVRDYMIEHPKSGLLNIFHPSERPIYEPANLRVLFPKYDAVALIRSAADPESIRGLDVEEVWADELAKWMYLQKSWENLEFALRQGDARCLITTTPRNVKVLREILADTATVVTGGSTYDNIRNLSPRFIKRIVRRYEGTRLGRQELHAHLLTEIEGALWTQELLELHRRRGPWRNLPEFVRVVVAVDPPATSEGAECGIVVCALGTDGEGYLLEDRSLQGRPQEWGRQVVQAYYDWEADRVIAERNNGGEMVEHTIQSVAGKLPVRYKPVWASRGKVTRAEPVSALDEKGRIHHVGSFPELEDQMCNWKPGMASPDRMDARVWGFTELFGLSSKVRAEDDYDEDLDEVHVW